MLAVLYKTICHMMYHSYHSRTTLLSYSSYTVIYVCVTGHLRNPCVYKQPRVFATALIDQGVCKHPRAYPYVLGCLQTP